MTEVTSLELQVRKGAFGKNEASDDCRKLN